MIYICSVQIIVLIQGKAMNTDNVKIPPQLPVGWAKDLARECEVSRMTVTHAIRYNGAGAKATKVREAFVKKYGNLINN
jgi:hypothetical protein